MDEKAEGNISTSALQINETTVTELEFKLDGDDAPLFGSVQERRKTKSKSRSTSSAEIEPPENQISIEVLDTKKELKVIETEKTDVSNKKEKKVPEDVPSPVEIVEFKEDVTVTETKLPQESIIEKSKKQNKNVKSISESTKSATKKSPEPETVLKEVLAKTKEPKENKSDSNFISDDFIQCYWVDYHQYYEAESNFYQNFKVVKVLHEPQPPVPHSERPKSSDLERIVQESKMKVSEPTTQTEEVTTEITVIADTESTCSVLREEPPKYPIVEMKIAEKQWTEKKESKTNEDRIPVKEPVAADVSTKIPSNITSELQKEDIAVIQVEAAPQSAIQAEPEKEKPKEVHLVADDDWMSMLDEPMVIDDDDFDDETVKNLESKAQPELSALKPSKVPSKPLVEQLDVLVSDKIICESNNIATDDKAVEEVKIDEKSIK